MGEGGANAKPRAKKRGYHHGDLARALVTAALSIVESKGPDALTLREAAAAVGVTHAAAYRHFEDKTALLAAIAEEGWKALHKTLTETLVAEARSPHEQVKALSSAYVAFALARPSYYRVMMGLRLNEGGRFPSLEAAINDAWSFVVAAIERGQKLGKFRAKERPRDLAIGIWVSAHGYVELVLGRRLHVKSHRVAIEYFESLLAPYLDGLAPDAPPRTRG